MVDELHRFLVGTLVVVHMIVGFGSVNHDVQMNDC